MTGRHPADEPFAVADWRRRVAQMYADVRRVATDDPAAAHAIWVQRRDELLAEHPASPLDVVAKASFEGLDIPHHDPAYRFECEVLPATAQRLDVSTGGGRGRAVRAHRHRRAGRPGHPRGVGDPHATGAACSSR